MARRREAHKTQRAATAAARGGARASAGTRATTLPWWQPVVLAIVVVLGYANGLSGPLVFDDKVTILENRQIRSLASLRSLLQPERELPVAGRPVANITLALNYAVHGVDVRGYRAVNVAIHLLCGLLVLGVVRRTLSSQASGDWVKRWAPAIAFASAALWTAHPLNSEAVSYLTQRTELLMALFYLGTLYAAIRAGEDRRRAWWTLAAVACCAAGMGSKESMVTAPVIVLLYDRVFRFPSFRASMAERWPLYAALASTWVILAVLQSTGPRMYSAGFSTGVSPWTYLLNQTTMIVRYLRLALWPDALVIHYGEPLPLTLAHVWPHAVLVVLLATASALVLVRKPALGFAGAWFFITLAPTSSIVPIATEVGAERRMYLPLIALAVVAAAAGLWLAQALRVRVQPDVRPGEGGEDQDVPTLAVAALVLVIGTFAAVTMHRNQEYRSPLVLAETSYERWPTPVAHHMVATELSLAGREEEALKELRQSVMGYPRGQYDLGVALFRKKEFADAIRSFDAFVSRFPLLLEVVEARALTGRAHFALQQYPEAIAAFEDALQKRPSRMDVHGALADALVKAQRPAEAIAHYRRYLSAFPRDPGALGSLAVLLVERNELPEAVELFRRAVEADPDNAGTRRNLAGTLFATGDVAGALEHARRAAALAPADPLALDLFGLLLLEVGQAAEAVRAFEQAARLAPGDPEIRGHLGAAVAKAGRPGTPADGRRP